MNSPMRLIERFFEARPRKIRRKQIGPRVCVACPMLSGFLRDSGDCASCEFNLGEKERARGLPIQLCGHGRKARSIPGWIVKLRELLQKIPMPKPRVPVRFQWRRNRNRPLSAIEKRSQERRRIRERERAKRQLAIEMRQRSREERERRLR